LKIVIKIKSYILFFGVLYCVLANGYSQIGFTLPEGVKKDKISFHLINNLVVIPVEVNGVVLTFLLDTGVTSTIMFSLSKVDSLELKNTTSVKLRGLGDGGHIPALKSKNNTLKIGNAKDVDHTVYVIFDESLDLSTRMGVPIHGIVGYNFFKNFIVKTNYNKQKLTIYEPASYQEELCNKCEIFDLNFHNKKPYLTVFVKNSNFSEKATLLIDSGSSDAIWLFNDDKLIADSNKKYFDDFLGQGLSGVIFGKRAKLDSLKIGSFVLEHVKVAYPDDKSMENIKFFEERDGSIGGEILMRFTTIMDYPSKKITLKKNNKFRNPFHYNMSGITIKHEGVSMVKEKINSESFLGKKKITLGLLSNTVYNYFLTPKFIISEVREGSPAELTGVLKGDEIISINGKAIYQLNLPEIIGLFASKAGKKIILVLKRKEIELTKKFYLKEVL